MKNSWICKILLFIAIFLLLSSSLIPLVSSINQNHNVKEKTIRIKAYNIINGCVTEHYLLTEEIHKIIGLMDVNIPQESLLNQVEEKLYVLKDIGIVAPESVNFLTNCFKKRQENLKIDQLELLNGPIFDLFNFFNGVFFLLKGEKGQTILELNMYQFPFFDGNITAQFSFLSKFSGNGFIFTLGTLGFKYLYDYNTSKYEFPYFPEISGFVLGYTGVLFELEIEADIGEEYEGSYVIGIGNNIASMWNHQD